MSKYLYFSLSPIITIKYFTFRLENLEKKVCRANSYLDLCTTFELDRKRAVQHRTQIVRPNWRGLWSLETTRIFIKYIIIDLNN